MNSSEQKLQNETIAEVARRNSLRPSLTLGLAAHLRVHPEEARLPATKMIQGLSNYLGVEVKETDEGLHFKARTEVEHKNPEGKSSTQPPTAASTAPGTSAGPRESADAGGEEKDRKAAPERKSRKA